MLQEGLVIQIARINDAPVLTELGVTTFCEAYSEFNKKENVESYITLELNIGRITEELSNEDNVFFIATYKDIPVGYSKMRTIKKPGELADNNPIEIERIYVLKDYYAKKIGSALMKTCIEHARSKQHDVIWLGVWEHNHKAINFYRSWGYELFSSHIFRFGNEDQTDVLMKKVL
jgi:diamine N-acetyltransferase